MSSSRAAPGDGPRRASPISALPFLLAFWPLLLSACGTGQGTADAPSDRAAEDAPGADDAAFESAVVPDGFMDELVEIDDAGDEDEGSGADAAVDEGDAAGEGDAPGIWHPAPGTSWQWQLTDYPVDRSFDVRMYDLDLFDTPLETIDALHTDGRIVVCYFSAGSWENWRDDRDRFPASALGNELDGWPDERWLDTRDPTVREIMADRLDLAAAKDCDGVEPDNVDGYDNDPGFPLTAATQLDYNRFLAAEAHARGLSIGLKNDLEQIPDLVDAFDWALNEECFAYEECDSLSPFVEAGKAVFQTEYGDASLADVVCPRADALDLDTIIKNLDLDAWRVGCPP